MLEDVLKQIEAENDQEKVWIVGPETGRFLEWLVRVVAPEVVVEIGTSVGYSALWIAGALRKNGRGKLWTIESHAGRYERAAGNIVEAEMGEWICQVKGHAPEIFMDLELPGAVDFVFLDATKMEHHSYLDALEPLLAPGAVLAVDNVLSHEAEMHDFVERVRGDGRFESVVLPLGSGLLVARKVTPPAAQ